MDRISNLPDDLCRHVISLLSAKEAACLKYTSKKWAKLLTVIPSAVFGGGSSSSSAVSTTASLKDCADELSLARRAIHRLRRFSLKLQSLDFAQYSMVNDCLRDVLKCGVLDLELDINVQGDYSLPSEIFTCKSVVKLKLGSGFVIDSLPKNALLPALKTLLLESVRFDGLDGCAFQRLLSACPVLEELVIDGFNCEFWNWSRTVYSLTLKRLTIRRAYSEDYQGADYESISFDTPSLAYLEYCDVLQDAFPVVNLDSLVEAKLNLTFMTARSNTKLTNLFQGLKHVQILRLDFVDTALTSVLSLGFTKASMDRISNLPDEIICHIGSFFSAKEAAFTALLSKRWKNLFETLFHLSITAEGNIICWNCLQLLLKKSPNLKALTIKASVHYKDDEESVCECLKKEYSFLSSCYIEVIKITEFKGDREETVQIKHMLEKLPCLLLLEVHLKPRRDEAKLIQILADLLMIPRSSSKCTIKLLH
ncbi:PREDICTED: F-box protein At3g62430-like [Camelina sativa]|uniref:F-box protein At3g62430-like n=1 Tax=Camelina sativa TaxID=90675 RepID=A0ABM0TUL0_CAMSA|nr:PREDICTED: F-box protein At3g62430-like [Camelina sativa]